jgi:hypothetical protein
MKNPNVSYRLFGFRRPLRPRFGVANLDICPNVVDSIDKPEGMRLLLSRQPAITQSLWEQQVIVMTLAPTVPVSQPQLSSTKATQGWCCFRKDNDNGVGRTNVRRSCAEL